MICELLRELNDDGLMTPKRLAQIFGVSTGHAYTYLTKTEMGASDLAVLFNNAWTDETRRVEVQRRILDALSDGTAWTHELLTAELDVNGDHEIDIHDLLDDTVMATTSAAESIKLAREADRGFKTIAEDEAASLRSKINHAIQHLLAARQIVAMLDASRPRGRKQVA